MKTVIGIICILTLTGCSRTLYPGNYENAKKVCLVNEGIRYVAVGPARYDVICRNGATFNNYLVGGPKQ